MPKKKQQPKQRQGREAGEGHAWLEPSRIRFAHAKIARTFTGCGRPVRDTLAQIERGELQADQLPTITVLPLAGADGDQAPLYCSLNNRRLWVLKQCAERGLLPDAGGGAGHVRVRVRARAPHEDSRYTVERCSEKARFVSYVSRYKRAPIVAGQKASEAEANEVEEDEVSEGAASGDSSQSPASESEGEALAESASKGGRGEDVEEGPAVNDEAGGDEGEDARRGGGRPLAPKAEAKATAPAPKARRKKGRAGGSDEGDYDSEGAETADAAAPRPSAGGKHPQYIVAKVLSADKIKKKKGYLICELQTGTGTACAVTGYVNVEAGMKVILAPEGSEVYGKEVKRVKVAGEWTSGIICGPMEMGWPGDASRAVVVGELPGVGDPAPAALEAGVALEEDAGESEGDEPKAPPIKKAGGAKKANAFAALESDEGDPDELASDKSDDGTKCEDKKSKSK